MQFDDAHRSVHYPDDRRFRVWLSPRALVIIALLAAAPFVAAWIQGAVFGLPSIAEAGGHPHADSGFPAWVRWSHFFNFLFLSMLIRSGLSILMDHPRLYLDDHCTPGTEWLRFTPLLVPKQGMWTAKDEARYISPLVALPGYRHTIGVARAWHFLNVYGFVLTGMFFVAGLATSSHWLRLVPTSPTLVIDAWNTFVHYANLAMPPEPNGFYAYNPLQQLAYFAAVFIMAPLSILTGLAMSPALVNHAPWYAKIFGGRQAARSIHFILLVGFVGFFAVHVALVVLTGFARNMNHIVLGTDDSGPAGAWLGAAGIAVVVGLWVVAHLVSWRRPRALQRAHKLITRPVKRSTFARLPPIERYTRADISPHFWPNGKLPTRADWQALAAGGFADYRLRVTGLVQNPLELSLADMRRLGTETFVTMHHCIQGWSGIAEWTGLSLRRLLEVAKPHPEAKVVAFFSYGEALYGGTYYDTQTIEDAMKPQCLLAFVMNGEPLSAVYGAPLRLRAENQLGFKMVKWIERIELVASEKTLGEGEGGSNEDHEYFDLDPYI